MEVALCFFVLLVGVGIGIFVYRSLDRPQLDEEWMDELLQDIRNSTEGDQAMTIEISKEDLAALNTGQPVTLQGPVIVVPPTLVHWVYTAGMFGWLGGWDFGVDANYEDTTGAPVPGPKDLALTVRQQWGGWLPHAPGGAFDTTPYKNFMVSIKTTIDHQSLAFYVESAHDTKDGTGVDLTTYAVESVIVGEWMHYQVPIADLKLTDPVILKFCIQDKTGSVDHVIYIDNVGFAP